MSSSRAINAENKVQYINRKRRIRDNVISKRCLWRLLRWLETWKLVPKPRTWFGHRQPKLMLWCCSVARLRCAQFIFIPFSFYCFCYWSLIFDNFQVSLNFRHSFSSHSVKVATPRKFEDVGVTYSEKWDLYGMHVVPTRMVPEGVLFEKIFGVFRTNLFISFIIISQQVQLIFLSSLKYLIWSVNKVYFLAGFIFQGQTRQLNETPTYHSHGLHLITQILFWPFLSDYSLRHRPDKTDRG